jgi:hypothetical protein
MFPGNRSSFVCMVKKDLLDIESSQKEKQEIPEAIRPAGTSNERINSFIALV